jgi:hypothetical protein
VPVSCVPLHILSKRFSTFKESLSSFYELFTFQLLLKR